MRYVIFTILILGLFLTLTASGQRAIICSDMEEWQSLEDRVHSGMIADGAIQERWSEVKVNPVTGQIAFVVESRMEKHLTDDELERIIDLPDDWTPIQEEL